MRWTTDHYHPSSNIGLGISEGCFIFHFGSLLLEAARPILPTTCAKVASNINHHLIYIPRSVLKYSFDTPTGHVATVNDSIFFDKLHFSRRISFVPVFKSEIKMPDDVKIACHGDESCIYDSLVTGAYIKFVDNF